MYNNNNIKDQLKQETDEILELKDDTWHKIQQKLPTKVPHLTKKRKRKQWIAIASMAFAVTLIWISLSTPTGLAIIQNMKEMFVPHKTIELDIEGQKENTDVDLETNEDLRYAIYIDTSRYKMVKGPVTDEIVPNEALGDEFPDVSMKITPKETTTETAIENIKEEIEAANMNITIEEETTTPIEASFISAIGQGEKNESGDWVTQWDTPVYQYFVTKEQSGQVFIIKQKYFLEAAEGHGARFDAMLETFEIVE